MEEIKLRLVLHIIDTTMIHQRLCVPDLAPPSLSFCGFRGLTSRYSTRHHHLEGCRFTRAMVDAREKVLHDA
jgi:hypothetical protein